MGCIKIWIMVFVGLCLKGTVAIAQNFERIETKSGFVNLSHNNGVAVADFDNDNDLDVFFVAYLKDDPTDMNTASRLFRNNNDGTFTDVTQQMGIENLFPLEQNTAPFYGLPGTKFGVSWGDFNNDHYPDLFFTHLNKIHLFKNNQGLFFTEITQDALLQQDTECAFTGATWFDYNNDGFLDLYLCDWDSCEGNVLYKNNGNETFSNVTQQTGLAAYHEEENFDSYTAFPYDFNADGFMDIYVSNDFSHANRLYLNYNGEQFVDAASAYGLNYASDDMGIAIGDFNSDGAFDFFVSTISNNALFESTNNGLFFNNVSEALGVKDTGWGWGVTFADFDLDTDEDLIVVNGFDLEQRGPEQNMYFENQYQESTAFKVFPFEEMTYSMQVCDFDYDNDGDLDLLVTNAYQPPYFFENHILNYEDINSKNWLKIKLTGAISNLNAVGTVLELETNYGTYKRYNHGVGMLSQSIKPVHFGLNADTSFVNLTIYWPSGIEEHYKDLNPNTFYEAIEGQDLINLNMQPSQKIEGCTDPESCNYNPLATIDNGSCTYLKPYQITGPEASTYYKTESYAYNVPEDSAVNWTVIGGEIMEGQGTETISVLWHVSDTASVSAKEIGTFCSGETSQFNVSLSFGNHQNDQSIARVWNELLLEGIRGDYAKPTVHARNLFHSSMLMYEIWALHHEGTRNYFFGKNHNNIALQEVIFKPYKSNEKSIAEAISFAMYRLLSHRYANTPGFENLIEKMNTLMVVQGFDPSYISQIYQYGNSAALGNFMAAQLINFGLNDGSRELDNYENAFYTPLNTPLVLDAYNPSDFNAFNPNHWQPLTLEVFIDQSGNEIDNNTPDFLSPEWGAVYPFALQSDQLKVNTRNQNQYQLYLDPGAPPSFDDPLDAQGLNNYKSGFAMVSVWGAHLSPDDGVVWDISPAAIGKLDFNNFNGTEVLSHYNYLEGGDYSTGHKVNPISGRNYEPNLVKRGDYTRVLAEFWADGPDSETPPGHWFTILNYINDNAALKKQFEAKGELLSNLEWDIKAYFTLGGAMHDAAIAAWSVKGWYDYIRPVSAIRYMCIMGQCTNPDKPSYNTLGIPLIPGFIELIEQGDPLVGINNENLNKIKVKSWKGHDYVQNTQASTAGVGWIIGERWWPYQRPSFVTPPFAGYVSGHSTYSRAAAEVLSAFTGSPFFPGGIGEFKAPKNNFLIFEKGPSQEVKLQWATYADAADQCSLSRIWGGIHPPADDIPGRLMGELIGKQAFQFAKSFFSTEQRELETSSSLDIYPNPVRGNELIVSGTTIDSEIQLFDLNGRQMPINAKTYNSEIKQTKLILAANTSPGIYVLKVSGNSFKLVIK